MTVSAGVVDPDPGNWGGAPGTGQPGSGGVNPGDRGGVLVKLGDRRGYDFLVTSLMSDDDEILETAKEIFESPELSRMKNEIEAERDAGVNWRRAGEDIARAHHGSIARERRPSS